MKTMMKTVIMCLVVLIGVVLFSGQVHACEEQGNLPVEQILDNYGIPEYLHHYVTEVHYDINDSGDIADSSIEGVIVIYSTEFGKKEFLREIGHIVHWRSGYLDPQNNTQTMANFFAYEAMNTNNLYDLLDRWNMWREIFRVTNTSYN